MKRQIRAASVVILETPRMIVRRWVPDDWKRFRTLFTDPRVMQYIGDGRPWSDARIRRWVEESIEIEMIRGWVLWPLVHREDSEVIGFCGFWHGFPPDVEMGWRLLPEYWGQGLMTEVAQALIDYGFETYKFERLIAVAQPANRASIRVMEKIGMMFEREFTHHGIDVVSYAREKTAKPGTLKTSARVRTRRSP
jgi:ribosomal-protein-alanine N-acetyltransferase